MKTLEEKKALDLLLVRSEHTKTPQFSEGNTHEAVICKSYYNGGKTHCICVNYWTPKEIEAGERNVFGTWEELIEKLYN